MPQSRIALTFQNEAEARLLEAMLVEADIPHFIRSFRDSAYGPIFQPPLGWGELEAPPEYHEQIRVLYADIVSSRE